MDDLVVGASLTGNALTVGGFSVDANRKRQRKADIIVYREGGPMTSVYLLMPHTQRGKTWLRDNVAAEDYQYIGPNLAVEHRYVADIVQGMIADGLEVR
jgi:hypothetical protein